MIHPGRPRWWRDAACRDQPIRLFFPAPGRTTQPAKAICAACPVIAHCDQWAMAQPEWLDGVFAGQARADRDRRRRSA